MNKTIRTEKFSKEYFAILDETFVKHHGIFLDRNTSLFETLKAITAAEASRPVGNKCATLAAQVAHVTFYLEVLENYILHRKSGKIDWGEIWRTVGVVTPQEWTALQQNLRQSYNRVKKEMRKFVGRIAEQSAARSPSWCTAHITLGKSARRFVR